MVILRLIRKRKLNSFLFWTLHSIAKINFVVLNRLICLALIAMADTDFTFSRLRQKNQNNEHICACVCNFGRLDRFNKSGFVQFDSISCRT